MARASNSNANLSLAATFFPDNRDKGNLMLLTQAELKTRLHYDPETGIFTWLPLPVVHYAHKSWNTRFAGKQAGFIKKLGYIDIALNHKEYKAHRLAWLYVYGYFPPDDIDHINRNKTDNQITNLREATRSQNQQNIVIGRMDSKSGFRGVYFHTYNNKYVAKISINKKTLWLGYYDTLETACQAYLIAKRKHHPFSSL